MYFCHKDPLINSTPFYPHCRTRRAEKAFFKLKAALGIEALERELVLIDPKTRPSEENERKIGDFCAAFTEAL